MVGAGERLKNAGEALIGAKEVLRGVEGVLVGAGEELVGVGEAEEERLKLRMGAGSPRMDLVWTSRDICSWQGSLAIRSSERGRPREEREKSAWERRF